MIIIMMTSVLAAIAAPQTDQPGHYVAGAGKSDKACHSSVQDIGSVDGMFMIQLKTKCFKLGSMRQDRHVLPEERTSLPLHPQAVELFRREDSSHAQK